MTIDNNSLESGRDIISPEDRMAQFNAPTRLPNKSINKHLAKLLCIAAISSFGIEFALIQHLNTTKPDPVKKEPLNTLVEKDPISLPNLAKEIEIEYTSSLTSVQDVLNGKASLKLGDSCPAVARFAPCFKLPASRYFTPALRDKIIKYQNDNLLVPTGEIDLQTVETLQKQEIISFYGRKTTFEIDNGYLSKVYDLSDPEDCLTFLDLHTGRSTPHPHAHSIENFMINSNIYQSIVTTALDLAKRKESPNSASRESIYKVKQIKTALELGIDRPLMFSSYALGKLIHNYQNATPEKFNACLVVTSYDYNGAFYSETSSDLIDFFADQGANIRFVMPRHDQELKTKFPDSLMIDDKACQADVVVYCCHGNSTGIQVAATVGDAGSIDDGEGILGSLTPHLAKGALEIFWSCSVANSKQRGSHKTLNNSLYQARGGKTTIVAANTSCSFHIGKGVKNVTGDPYRFRLKELKRSLIVTYSAPQLLGIMETGNLLPRAGFYVLPAKNN